MALKSLFFGNLAAILNVKVLKSVENSLLNPLFAFYILDSSAFLNTFFIMASFMFAVVHEQYTSVVVTYSTVNRLMYEQYYCFLFGIRYNALFLYFIHHHFSPFHLLRYLLVVQHNLVLKARFTCDT